MGAELSPTLDTPSGPVVGRLCEHFPVHRFCGIPYARQPSGRDRFLAPQPVQPWSEPLQADRYRAAPPQLEAEAELMQDPSLKEFSDACLWLNIEVPSGGHKDRLPVMFWIHGGGFNTGSGSGGLYRSGSLTATGNCILVTSNYRLGVLGFMRLDEATDGAIPSSGTEGLQDQLAALRWVRENISAFGGDPENITVFGESAGAMSLSCLLAMPAARGLFRRAIMQSGGTDVVLSKERACSMGQMLVEKLHELGHGREQIADLPSRLLVEAAATLRHPKVMDRTSVMGMTTVPVIDGEHLPVSPMEAVRQGQSADTDLLLGWNRDEWNFFSVFDPNQWQLSQMRMYEQTHQLTADAEKARQLIPACEQMLERRRRPTHPGAIFSQIMTDYAFRIPAMELLRAQRRAGGSARAYCFSWESPLAGGVLGACHALELPFVFGMLHPSSMKAWAGEGAKARQLSLAMQSAWAEFAAGSTPRIAGADWPDFEPENPVVADFGSEQTLTAPCDPASLAVWNT